MKLTLGKISSLFLLFCLFFMAACEKEYLQPIETEIPDSVSFQANIIPVFENHCNASGCHNTGGIAPDLSIENAYDDLFLYSLIDTLDPQSSILYLRMISSSNPMPPSGLLKTGDPELVLAWIEQGAKNN